MRKNYSGNSGRSSLFGMMDESVYMIEGKDIGENQMRGISKTMDAGQPDKII